MLLHRLAEDVWNINEAVDPMIETFGQRHVEVMETSLCYKSMRSLHEPRVVIVGFQILWRRSHEIENSAERSCRLPELLCLIGEWRVCMNSMNSISP